MRDGALRPVFRKMLLVGGLSAGLMACVGAGDPPQPGVQEGTDSPPSEADQRQLADRERELAEAEAANAALRSELARSRQDLVDLEAEEAQLLARLDVLERENQVLSRRLDALRQRRDVDEQELASLQSRFEMIRDYIARERCSVRSSLCQTSSEGLPGQPVAGARQDPIAGER